jgi:hypothetical protein
VSEDAADPPAIAMYMIFSSSLALFLFQFRILFCDEKQNQDKSAKRDNADGSTSRRIQNGVVPVKTSLRMLCCKRNIQKSGAFR